VNVNLEPCCPENPAVNKLDIGIGCSTDYTIPIVGQIINYFGYCYTIASVGSTNEGCIPAYQYYNTCSDCGPCITPTPTVTPTNTATPTATATPTNTATSIPNVCNQYRIENNTESSISISWFECDDNIFYDVLESGNQITFCSNQFYGLINYSSGSLFDLGLCPTPTPTSTATPTSTPTSSGGGGGGGAPSDPSSVYYDGNGNYSTDFSYLESNFESTLSIDPIVKGFTFSTWVKSNWLPGLGYPADFMKMSAPSLSAGCGPNSKDVITLSYDSETYQDGIFIVADWCQSDSYKSVSYFASLTEYGNDLITNIAPTPGQNSPWNSSTNNQFINITFTIDGSATFVNTSGDQSQSGVIYWNGQPLYTQETPPTIGSTSMFLSSFNSGSSIMLGGWRWARAHWQDQTLFCDMALNSGVINSVLYAGGTPVSDVTSILGRGRMFNYNEPYLNAWLDSTGVPLITLSRVGINLTSPIRDSQNYVA
jgi:hypothetical protein